MSSMTLLQNFQFTIRVNLPESGDLGEPATVWVNLPQSGDLVDLEKSRQQKLPIFTRIFMPCTYQFQEVICLCRFYVVLPSFLTFLLVVFSCTPYFEIIFLTVLPKVSMIFHPSSWPTHPQGITSRWIKKNATPKSTTTLPIEVSALTAPSCPPPKKNTKSLKIWTAAMFCFMEILSGSSVWHPIFVQKIFRSLKVYRIYQQKHIHRKEVFKDVQELNI